MLCPRYFAPLVSALPLLAVVLPAKAQIMPDTTLGSESSVITPSIEVRGDIADLIEGGAIRGANLFHSFSDFNINQGQRVYFANPTGIDSILNRVTGNNSSAIFGTLGVDGSADLFLVNPNGIIFGVEAQLDVEGSFYGTTAEAIEIGTGLFSAVAPAQSQLLAVSPNVSFWNYLTDDSGDVVNRGQLAIGGDLVLAGNNLDLQAQVAAAGDVSLLATDTVQIRDTTEVPFVGFSGSNLLIQGNQQVDIVALSHPDSGLFSRGNIVLRSSSPVSGDTHYQSGQDFRVEQLNGQPGRLRSPQDPVIRSLGDVSFESYIGRSLHILAGGSVRIPGVILITGPETGTVDTDFLTGPVTLSNGVTIVDIDGSARSTLDIRAGLDPALRTGFAGTTGIDPITDLFFQLGSIFGVIFPISTNPTLSNPRTDMRADIEIGSVVFADFASIEEFINVVLSADPQQSLINRLSSGDVLLTNNFQGNSSLEGNITVSSTINDFLNRLLPGLIGDIPNFTVQVGDTQSGGRIFMDARNNLDLNGIISASALPETTNFSAPGGDIMLLASENINLMLGTALISAGAPSGQIRVESDGTVMFDDSAVISLTTGGGKGANLVINASNVTLTNQAGLGSQTLGRLVSFIDNEDLENLLEGYNSSGILVTSFFNGQAGDLILTTDNLRIENNAPLSLSSSAGISTFSPATGGDLSINADSITIMGNDPARDFVPDPTRRLAFNINSIPTGITTAALGIGQGGDLTLNVRELKVRNGAGVTSGSVSTGSQGGAGGQLQINNTQLIELQGLAVIATGTLGPGNASDLIIENAGTIRLHNGATIATDTIGAGDAGNLVMTGERLSVLEGSRIGATSGDQGVGGNITLNFSEQITLKGTSPAVQGTVVPSGIFSNARGINQAGQISINTPALSLNDGAEISASTLGPGQGGSINIISNSLNMRDSTITASSVGRGDAGDIVLRIDGSTVLQDSSIAAIVVPDARLSGFELGNFAGWAAVGDTRIEGATFGLGPIAGTQQALLTNTLTDNAIPIFALDDFLNLPPGSLNNLGTAGNGQTQEGSAIKTVFVAQAGDQISFDWIFLTQETPPENIFNDFSFVSLNEVSQLANTGFPNGFGSGFNLASVDLANNNMPVPVSATGRQTTTLMLPRPGVYELGIGVVDVGDSDFTSGILIDNVQLPAGVGNGGNIDIESRSMDLVRSQITAQSEGLGNAGRVTVQVGGHLNAWNSDISTAAGQSSGGGISVTAENILLNRDSDIRTNVQSGQGGGGDILLQGNSILAFDDSDILAFAIDGQGGNIRLNTSVFFGENYIPGAPPPFEHNNRVDINASGRLASGTISLPDVSVIENNLTELPSNLANPDTLVANSCIVRDPDNTGTLIVTGHAGLPLSPNISQATYNVGTIRPVLPGNLDRTSHFTEPQTVYRLADGRLVMSRDCDS